MVIEDVNLCAKQTLQMHIVHMMMIKPSAFQSEAFRTRRTFQQTYDLEFITLYKLLIFYFFVFSLKVCLGNSIHFEIISILQILIISK